jgi:hypothetical protein
MPKVDSATTSGIGEMVGPVPGGVVAPAFAVLWRGGTEIVGCPDQTQSNPAA